MSVIGGYGFKERKGHSVKPERTTGYTYFFSSLFELLEGGDLNEVRFYSPIGLFYLYELLHNYLPTQIFRPSSIPVKLVFGCCTLICCQNVMNVRRFLAIFDLHTYLVLPYNVRFWGLSWTPLPKYPNIERH